MNLFGHHDEPPKDDAAQPSAGQDSAPADAQGMPLMTPPAEQPAMPQAPNAAGDHAAEGDDAPAAPASGDNAAGPADAPAGSNQPATPDQPQDGDKKEGPTW